MRVHLGRRSPLAVVAAVVVVLTSIAIAAPTGSSAQEAGDKDTVTVEARRTVDIEPDLVRITFGIGGRDRSAEVAMDEVSTKTAAVLDALESLGASEDELATVSVDLRRICLSGCRDRDRSNDVRGFKASAGVRLETTEIDSLGGSIDAAIGAGASSIRSLIFDVADDAAAVQEALAQAMDLAKTKAQTLAEAGERTLGRALVIVEGSAREPRAFAADAAAVTAAYGSGSSGQAFPIDPPTLDASARIEVTFELI